MVICPLLVKDAMGMTFSFSAQLLQIVRNKVRNVKKLRVWGKLPWGLATLRRVVLPGLLANFREFKAPHGHPLAAALGRKLL